jgi:hypothetical protein
LRASENGALRRIFGRKTTEIIGSWRKLRNYELHNLYSSPDITRMIKSRWREMGRTYRTFGTEEKCLTDFNRNS